MPLGNLGVGEGTKPRQEAPSAGGGGGMSILNKLRNTNEDELKNKLK